MKYDIALLVELVAASLARSQAAENSLAVAVHESHRTLPILESAGATAYVNLRPVHHLDFRPVVGGLPAAKERVNAQADRGEANSLLKRARIVVLCVPDDPAAIAALPEFDSAGKLCLIYGEPRAGGWSHITPRLRGGDFTPFEIGGARLLISREAVDGVGGRQTMMPNGIGDLADRLAHLMPSVLQVESHSSGVRLRIKPDPVRLVVAASESLAHNLAQENRALFNARGVGALALPLEGRGSLQILVRNVRDRIDSLTIAVGSKSVLMNRIDYTEYGAVLSLPPTEIESGRDALMFLSLPKTAVPQDGFCDIGAVTQTVELA
jgi:hypothetical protein